MNTITLRYALANAEAADRGAEVANNVVQKAEAQAEKIIASLNSMAEVRVAGRTSSNESVSPAVRPAN